MPSGGIPGDDPSIPDEDGVSVCRGSVLAAAGLAADAVVRAPQNLVLRLGIGEVRSRAGLRVRDDPWPQDIEEADHPRNAAHALIDPDRLVARGADKE